jgi:hypothetical protein
MSGSRLADLTGDAVPRRRQDPEPLGHDRFTAAAANSLAAVVDSSECGFDLL